MLILAIVRIANVNIIKILLLTEAYFFKSDACFYGRIILRAIIYCIPSYGLSKKTATL